MAHQDNAVDRDQPPSDVVGKVFGPLSRIPCHKLGLILAVCAAVGAGLVFGLQWLEIGRQLEQVQYQAAGFQLQITAHEQRMTGGLGAPGAYYEYHVRSNESEPWRKLIRLLLGTADPIPKDQLREVSETTAYFYLDGTFGITHDAGATWKIRSVDTPPIAAGLEGMSLQIDDLQIASEGRGTMGVSGCLRDDWQKEVKADLESADSGTTWSLVK